MTTDLCQGMMDLLRSKDAFAALRVPAPTVAVTESLPLPLVFEDGNMPALYLVDRSSYQTVISGTLVYRPERQTFAANALPSAPGEHWVTFGLDDAPLTCPSNLNLPAKGWQMEAHFALDLSGQPDNCEGCTLPYYLCYAGQEEPLAAAASLAGKLSTSSTYQGDGITCIGPTLLHLTDWLSSEWDFSSDSYAYVTPTVTTTVALRYEIY